MADEWPTAAAEYQIIEQIGQVRWCFGSYVEESW